MPASAEIVERFVGAKEVAAIVGYTPELVKRMARDGEIPGIRGNGRSSAWRFRISEVLDALRFSHASG